MLGRRRIDTTAPLRSSLANAAFAVEERVLWGGADVLRRLLDAAKWPFERIIWAIERGLVWPLEERTGDWGVPLRVLGVVALALLAAGAGVLGLVWASGSGSTRGATQTAAQRPTPVIQQIPNEAAAPAPLLHGVKPDFTTQPKASLSNGDKVGAPGSTEAATNSATPKTASTETVISSSPGASGSASVVPAGPPATTIAHRFAGAFVLYETGQNSAKVRTTFAATATPQLAHSLLRRPPRLPAGVKVPRAKVVNVVSGPHHGGTYTLSVSLLRVGVTSELRLEMQRDPKTGVWQVTKVLG
ncbi:MAG: hypothetical protein QOF85_2594 [Solirubrobacterales bacterium]|jgi:hypothetical protein|nr:hypothetical protein [Solirubrobacterales bacterium]